ncbi:MAG: biopolymer transporter ExbD [Bacteroidetes bacterium]|nr:biopolymer transporter ExbD [Bacteroidota bacterium]
MRIRRNRETAEVSTESLNDIMFFLMLFFLIVSTLINPNVIKLLLPNSKTTASLAKQPITVSITADRLIYINKQLVAEELFESTLKQLVAGNENPTVVVRADGNLSVQDLVNVLQVGDALKVKMVLATKSEK